jgi:ZIP family zinc transporter
VLSAISHIAVLIAVGTAAGVATLLGGALRLRFRAPPAVFTAFAGGAVLGVAAFDLGPEALRLTQGALAAPWLCAAAAAGFAAYLAINLATATVARTRGLRGHLGAGALTLHSLMDGLGVGFAFAASAGVGLIVAAAVLTHDLFDGANTVTLALSGRTGERAARRWLAADAAAPLAGIALSALFAPARPVLGLLLALLAGFFLCISFTELLAPAFTAPGARLPRVASAVAGLALMASVVRLAGG